MNSMQTPGLEWEEVEPAFEIRRRRWTYVLVALVMFGLAAGFAWFAYDDEKPLYWIAVGVLALFGLIALPGVRDGRTPVFVADRHGVRMRSDEQWVGLLWSELADVRVKPRSGLRDAYVKVVSIDGQRVLTAPLGMTTTANPGEAEIEIARRRTPAA